MSAEFESCVHAVGRMLTGAGSVMCALSNRLSGLFSLEVRIFDCLAPYGQI